MANDFMYGVPPRHTHGENRVKRMLHHYSIPSTTPVFANIQSPIKSLENMKTINCKIFIQSLLNINLFSKVATLKGDQGDHPIP